ncbi:MAG: MTH938/NDUFAF3 family protein [Desulfohalobiaceae bacterium]|nr:MTH938/NDUFAF3 family protein [Desulfohalobiaceae bacterium]
MIEGFRFGEIVISGTRYGNDVKILAQGDVIHPWWRGSGHRVEPGDVQDILGDEPQVLILGMGQPGQMTASPALRNELDRIGIRLVEKPTAQAMEEFNAALDRGERVCAGLHLTC